MVSKYNKIMTINKSYARACNEYYIHPYFLNWQRAANIFSLNNLNEETFNVTDASIVPSGPSCSKSG